MRAGMHRPGIEPGAGRNHLKSSLVKEGLRVATANFTTKPPMLCMKRRGCCMGLVGWLETSS